MAAVIDANCWCLYVDEAISESNGPGKAVFEKAEHQGGILFDAGNLMRQQYIDMRKPYAEDIFNNWFGEKQIYGLARLVDVPASAAINTFLRNNNIPNKEHIFFKTAISGNADHIVSLDSDFYDPAMKRAGEETKRKLVQSASGPVCKAVRKAWGISICCPVTYVAKFEAAA
jgi:hypothetical protein